MNVISINIGKEQPIGDAGKGGTTGIFKQPVSCPVRVTALGLSGDTICDLENHGGPDQAVYLYGAGDYDWWSQTLGQNLAPGTFGENLTISELESADYCVGDRLMMGEVILEVTSPRIPCGTLSARMGDQQFVKRFRDAERPGLYCRVIQTGMLTAGDPVTVERYSGFRITMREIFHNFYLPKTEDFLRRCLAAPIAIRTREEIAEKLEILLNQAQ